MTNAKRSYLENILRDSERAVRYWENALIANIADEIELVLEDRNWSKKDLADKVGMSPEHIYRLLTGQRTMTLKTLARICFALDARPQIRLLR